MLNRFLYADNTVLSDYTRELQKYRTGTATIPAFVATQDYLYLGSRAPFNHYYFKMSTPNTNPNTLTLAIWDGTVWDDVYETVDETKGFTQSGYIYFVPEKDSTWNQESTNDRGEQVSGLTSVRIHDLYWLRIKSSANWSSNVVFTWFGQKFSDDDDLRAEFPDLVRSAMLTGFEAGKTDWEEQHVKAAEIIAADLVASNIIDFREQILVREEFTLASVQKVAELIYSSFGDDYAQRLENAKVEYKSRMNKSIYRVDKNANAILSENESRARQGFLSR